MRRPRQRVLGVGWAMVLTPLVGFVLAGLPADRAGLAGGVLTTALQVGLSVGASVLGSVLFEVAGSDPTPADWKAATLVAVTILVVLAFTTAVACTRLGRRT